MPRTDANACRAGRRASARAMPVACARRLEPEISDPNSTLMNVLQLNPRKECSMSTNQLAVKPFATPIAKQRPAPFKRLPDQVTIEHGPAALLGRAILKADEAARRRGVYLSLAGFEELVTTNQANRDTWRAFVPIFHPKLGGATAESSFSILGYDIHGDVVATQAARLYDWHDSNFQVEAESLRLFYANPERDKLDGERCVVSAPAAKRISGHTVFSGCGWYRPDYRKKSLSAILPRVARVISYTRWQQDYTVSMVADAVFRGGMAERSGYTNAEPKVDLINSPAGTISLYFIWMETMQLLEDLDWFVSSFDTEVDGWIDDRYAHQSSYVVRGSKR